MRLTTEWWLISAHPNLNVPCVAATLNGATQPLCSRLEFLLVTVKARVTPAAPQMPSFATRYLMVCRDAHCSGVNVFTSN